MAKVNYVDFSAPSGKLCSSKDDKEARQFGPGYSSPMEAFTKGPKETLLYVPAMYTNTGIDAADYLATVDIDEKSDTFCQVIHRLELGKGAEVHHSGWDACSSCHHDPSKHRRHLILPTIGDGDIFVIDTEDLKAPKLKTVVRGSEIKEKLGVSNPHTSHCLATGDVMVSTMGDADDQARGDFLLLDAQKNFEIKGTWSDKPTRFGYDFWYQPRLNVMVSSEWGNPSKFKKGFNPAHVAEGHYGGRLYVWNWTERQVIQQLDLGPDGLIPLEVRFLHEPTSPHGYVGCALSSSVFHFFLDEATNQWKAEKVIQVEPVSVEGWALPNCPGLITDIILSLDDKYLYFSNWLQGDIRQYDITDRFHPKLVGQVFTGGTFREGSNVKVKDPNVKPPQVPEVKGTELTGGPQMIQLSLDGKRLYVTNSLFSTWDVQFYPDMVQQGSKLLRINIDTENGGLSIDSNFLVDFGKEPNGPSLAHEIRYPGGDCTSDIWI